MTFRSMMSLCSAQGGTLVSAETLPTGWGTVTAEVHEYKFSDRSAMVMRLPHLSTFQFFSRSECKAPSSVRFGGSIDEQYLDRVTTPLKAVTLFDVLIKERDFKVR